jgi:hypothetical protein
MFKDKAYRNDLRNERSKINASTVRCINFRQAMDNANVYVRVRARVMRLRAEGSGFQHLPYV